MKSSAVQHHSPNTLTFSALFKEKSLAQIIFKPSFLTSTHVASKIGINLESCNIGNSSTGSSKASTPCSSTMSRIYNEKSISTESEILISAYRILDIECLAILQTFRRKDINADGITAREVIEFRLWRLTIPKNRRLFWSARLKKEIYKKSLGKKLNAYQWNTRRVSDKAIVKMPSDEWTYSIFP